MLKQKRRIAAALILLVIILSACAGEPDEVSYRILSPTPRPQLETTRISTVDTDDLTIQPSATALPTATPTRVPTEVPSVTLEPTDTHTPVPTATSTEPGVATQTTTATEPVTTSEPETTATTSAAASGESSSGTTNNDVAGIDPTPTSINDLLRQQQTDRNFLVQMSLSQSCFETNSEIPVRVVVRNFNQNPIYLYKRGQILFSINNSPLGPDFPPPEPSLREDFELLEIEDFYVWEIEDLGLAIQGMGPTSGIDFGDTFLGLPPGDYWVTAAYANDKDGLTEQIDGTYLIPEAAWRGIAVSREVRFTVVEETADCPTES